MSSKTLELGNLLLTLNAEKLKLEVASKVDIKCPSGWSPQDNDTFVKALAYGNVWVSRGRRCRLDIDFFLNGKPLDNTSRISILESLGYHLCDAHIWSQLSLSTSLELPQSSPIPESSTDISIYISHAISSPDTEPKTWLLDNIDIKAPDSVVCAEFERLHMQLHFHQIWKRPRATSKRVKTSLPDPNSPESMLLDYISGLEDDARFTFFENVASVLPEELSSSIAKCFDEFKTHGAEDLMKLLGKAPPSYNDQSYQEGNHASSKTTVPKPVERRKGQRFPKETVDKLRAWLDSHPKITSPTNVEILDLMRQTGLERRQVSDWFKARRRKKPTVDSLETTDPTKHQNDASRPSQTSESQDENDEDMLLSQFEDEMLFDEKYDEKYDDRDEDEMLLSQTTSATPTLISQASTISNISSTISLKRQAIENQDESDSTSILTTLSLAPANDLISIAIRAIIAGPSNRKGDLKGIQIGKPPPSFTLSTLVPSMFCPGFKQLMAHNSKFLPTISNAICSSWVRNVQGVILRQKLIALSKAKVSEYHDGYGEEGSAERLTSVVQARLWSMLQRTSYDQDAVKKLWKKDESQGAEMNLKEDDCENDDLLGEDGEEEDIDKREDRLGDFTKMDDDDELLFEDPLGEDRESDDGLLDYLEEQERLAIEAETEEMLIRGVLDGEVCKEGGVDDELLLLGVGSPIESMLS